ncbi:hypothetical protein C1645_811742 [Glomus cerebriforme]|uniref:Uncharacterized protein n=1 Tax=Glomus cerebriforme TaxID=658196 RepID=A0A397TP93_9GLOM|nr:hypothetical protein C1645_811742 [Glomus cerebriforme]
MFKVDGTEYTFLTWFAEVPGKELTNILLLTKSEKEVTKKVKEEIELYKAGMTKELVKKILNAINNNRFLIRVKFVRDKSFYDGKHNYAFKIIDKYQPIQESKRAGEKILEYKKLDGNAVVYGLIRQPGARVEDVAELKKIFKRPIKLLDITHRTTFNSGKYRTDRFEEIEMQESQESLKIVELAEQVFGVNYAGGKLANEINDWHPIQANVHENIKQSYVEHRYRGCWNAPNY